jgi:hypothetical protein
MPKSGVKHKIEIPTGPLYLTSSLYALADERHDGEFWEFDEDSPGWDWELTANRDRAMFMFGQVSEKSKAILLSFILSFNLPGRRFL